MQMRDRCGSRGFTLVEVLIGLVVLGMAATATALTMQSAANFVGENAMHIDAIAQAQETMEGLRALRYEELASGSKTSADGRFSISWSVQQNTPEEGMKAVDVSANWLWKGRPRSYVISTVYSKITRN